MENETRVINVKRGGEVILSLSFNTGSGVVLEEKSDYRQGKGNGAHREQRGGNGGRGNGDDSMTYPQKRLLFRLMAQDGFEGDDAKAELQRRFQVDSLEEVSKSEASRMIEQLLAEAKGDGDGLPI